MSAKKVLGEHDKYVSLEACQAFSENGGESCHQQRDTSRQTYLDFLMPRWNSPQLYFLKTRCLTDSTHIQEIQYYIIMISFLIHAKEKQDSLWQN